MLLHKIEKEKSCGWRMKKPVKFPIKKLFKIKFRKKLRYVMSDWFKGEEIRVVEYEYEKEEVHYCE